MIKSIDLDPEVGVIYEGTVVKTMDFGAFVNFFGAKMASCISASSPPTASTRSSMAGEGDKVKVKLLGGRARQGAPVDEGSRSKPLVRTLKPSRKLASSRARSPPAPSNDQQKDERAA